MNSRHSTLDLSAYNQDPQILTVRRYTKRHLKPKKIPIHSNQKNPTHSNQNAFTHLIRPPPLIPHHLPPNSPRHPHPNPAPNLPNSRQTHPISMAALSVPKHPLYRRNNLPLRQRNPPLRRLYPQRRRPGLHPCRAEQLQLQDYALR